MSEFVHLHVHTQYSLLDGFSFIPKLVSRAKELDMPALAITDHGVMYGVVDFYKEAQQAGVKPIIGIEAYMAARGMHEKDPQLDRSSTHLLLLAENLTGYKNLLKIASASQLDGFYYYPRIDHDFLADNSEGLICTSGCMSAEIPRALLRDNPNEARRKLDWYFEVFGTDNFYIELQSHDIPEIPKLNRQLIEMGAHYQAKYVATNDVHYVDATDAPLQDILLCVQTTSLLSDPRRMRMSDDSFYLKSGEEMSSLFADIPEALSNTLMIAERCNVDLKTDGYVLPEFDVPEGHTTKTYLRELCEEGLRRRYGDHTDDPEIQERLEYELGIIDQMGFNAYFLIVWDLCQFASREGIWYNARGSASGSIVAYSLGITLVDPIEHGLIFERFLNPGRVSMPDIDLDFQDDQRYRMMEYCVQRYGEDKVAAIITFGKLKARAAVRDVGRVMDIPLSEVDKIAKMIPGMPLDITIEDALEQVPELKMEYETKTYVQNLLNNAMQVEGSIRSAGTHAAGVVVTDKPVVEYIPLNRPTGAAAEDTPIKTVTQFEMKTIDELGLLKIDFLGLSTLTIMQRCCQMVQQRHGEEFNLYNIPLDDQATFDQLGNGNTAGVFQLEGSGMTRWVKEMRPQRLSHLIAMVALYRPGPMEFIPQYIRRMHEEEEITYRHERLKPVLEETYGITVYQEQIMYTAMEIGGYTASEADFLRKAVAKKKEDVLLNDRAHFVKGAKEQGVPGEAAEAIFNDWEAFARYGFPKGHAADYAVIAVETAYLKTHYPVEYMTALLSVSQTNSDKVASYVADCRINLGIEVLPPDINCSDGDFTIEDGEGGKSCIRFGMGAIKNVGHGPVDAILEARGDGPFEDITDLANRVDLRRVGKRALDSLVKAGALDSFGPRMALLQILDRASSISASHYQAIEAGQMTFFGADSGLVQRINLPQVDPDYNKREQLNWERDLIGLYVSEHPLNSIMKKLGDVITHFSSQLALAEDQQFVRIAGTVSRRRPHLTKKGKQMAFVGLEDKYGMIDVVVFPKTWDQYQELVQYEKILIVEGKVDTQRGDPKVLADRIFTVESWEVEAAVERPKPVEQKSRKPQVNYDPPAKMVEMKVAETINPPEWDTLDVPPPPEPPLDYWEMDEPESSKEPAPNESGPLKTPPVEGAKVVESAEVDFEEVQTSEPLPEEINVESPAVLEVAEEYHASVEVAVVAGDEGDGVGISDELIDEGAGDRTEQPTTYVAENEPIEPLPDIPAPLVILPEEKRQSNLLADSAPRMLTVVLRSLGDKARDILRMRRVHGIIISDPGMDKFAFFVIERSRGYRLEFPNDSTEVSDEMISRLEKIVGKENLIVELITYQ